jgi:hypothetical protein
LSELRVGTYDEIQYWRLQIFGFYYSRNVSIKHIGKAPFHVAFQPDLGPYEQQPRTWASFVERVYRSVACLDAIPLYSAICDIVHHSCLLLTRRW